MASNSKGSNRIRLSVKAEIANARAHLAIYECRKRRAEFALSLNRYDENGMMYIHTPDGVTHVFNKTEDIEMRDKMVKKIDRLEKLLEFMQRIVRHTNVKCLKRHTLYYVTIKRFLKMRKMQRINTRIIIGLFDADVRTPVRRAPAD